MVYSFSLINDGNTNKEKALAIVQNKMNIDNNFENKLVGIVKEQAQTEEASSSTTTSTTASNSSPLLSSLLLGKSTTATTTSAPATNGQKYEHLYQQRLQCGIMGARGTVKEQSDLIVESSTIKTHPSYNTNQLQSNHEEALMTQHLNLRSPEKTIIIQSPVNSNGNTANEANLKNISATLSDKTLKETLINNNNNNNNSKLLNCYESTASNSDNCNNSNLTGTTNTTTVAAASSSSTHPPKSILENCLLKPSTVKLTHHIESQLSFNKMDDKQQSSTSYYNSTFPAASDLSESRKVEPLKINLHRQPIRTVIKVPPASQQPPDSPKITIKPIKPPENEIVPKITIRPVVNSNVAVTVSPTSSTSSASSLSSSSSMENLSEASSLHMEGLQKTIQVIPKLHIKNYSEGSGSNCEASEPYCVPKLVLRSVPTTPSTLPNQKHTSVIVNNSSNELNDSSNTDSIPKLTIKKDNHISSSNNGPGNHHHHHFNSNSIKNQHTQSVLSKDGVKLTIKSIPEPAVPKLTIKTDSDNMFVAKTVESNARCPSPIPKITIKSKSLSNSEQQQVASPIPKVTIKPIIRPDDFSSSGCVIEPSVVPKLNIKPIPKPDDLIEPETIPKLTIKTITNNDVNTEEKVVPKLVVKLPKDQGNFNEEEADIESISSSSSPSPPFVHKLNIKPIQPPVTEVQNLESQLNEKEKEPVPKIHIKFDQSESKQAENSSNNCQDIPDSASLKFSIKSLIENPENSYMSMKPLEVNTTICKNSDRGQDSPRIILKINKTNKETITTEIIPPITQQSSNNVPLQQLSSPLSPTHDKNHQSAAKNSDTSEANHAQNSSIKNSNLTNNNNNNLSSSNNGHVSGMKRTHVKSNLESIENVEVPKKVLKVAPIVEKTSSVNVDDDDDDDDDDDVIVLDDDDDSNSVDAVEMIKIQSQKMKEPLTAKEKASSSTKLEENQKNLSRILTRIQRQRKVEPEQNSQNSEKLQNLLILNDGEGSSNDCIIIQDDPLRIDKSENSQDTVPEEELPKRRLRGRPKKIVKVTPNVKQSTVVISPLKMQQKVENKKAADNDNESSDGESRSEKPSDRESERQDEESMDTRSESTMKSMSENSRLAGVKGRPRGRGRINRFIEVTKDGRTTKIKLDGHDDDDSPTFSIWNRSIHGSARGKRGRGARSSRGKQRIVSNTPLSTPNRSRENSVFTTPHNKRHPYHASTPSLYEDDTLMSTGDCFQTPSRMLDFVGNEDSQSSMFSNTGNTVEGSSRKRGKMEVCDSEGRTEFTVEMLAEYEWPQNHPSRESYMIQEQIAEYLGVKSFKRKYPDLMRRTVDMEERNFLYENGLASEKMCDLGLTAVYASEILDIMCNDYPDKYEEYRRYQREKQFIVRARFREPVDKGQLQKDKAVQSASAWNTQFNKERTENRRCCMDLQNLIVQKPKLTKQNSNRPVPKPDNYPVALVPGQYSDHYVKYTPEQLACYPINTVLVDYQKLEDYLSQHPNPYESSESEDSSDDEINDDDNKSNNENSGSSSSDSDSSSSDSDENDEVEDSLCKVCSNTQYTNKFSKPEKLIKCASCKNEAHPSCIEMSQKMYKRCLEYNWKCADCKSCMKCKVKRDNKMLFCDQCDRGFHIYCLGLRNVPEGRWHCDVCIICTNCGTKNPEGHPNPMLTHQQRQELSMIAHWSHEYTINRLTNIREHLATLCVPCGKKYKEMKQEETK